jgi:hypothetical protein
MEGAVMTTSDHPAPDPDKTLDRIRKVLAQAERAGTAEEAETYNKKAAELMARHGVHAALLAATGEMTDTIDRHDVAVDDPYSAGKARLLAWIARALRTRAVLHQRRGGRVTAGTIRGFGSDLERVELLYTSLLLQATTQLTRLRAAEPPGVRDGVPTVLATRLRVAVHQRLTAAEQQAEQEQTDRDGGADCGAALILADRQTLVERAFAEAFPGLGAARRTQLPAAAWPPATPPAVGPTSEAPR